MIAKADRRPGARPDRETHRG